MPRDPPPPPPPPGSPPGSPAAKDSKVKTSSTKRTNYKWLDPAVQELMAQRLAFPTEESSDGYARKLALALGIKPADIVDALLTEIVKTSGTHGKRQTALRKMAVEVAIMNEAILKGANKSSAHRINTHTT
jgi:hypothetical protein